MIERMKKRMLLMGAIVLVIIVVAIIVWWLVSLSQTLTFQQIENRMVKAAEKYIEDNPHYLDTADNGNVLISMNQLEQGYIEGLNNFVEETVLCFGEVRVAKLEDHIAYFPYLDCGDDYKTTSLAELIFESQEIVEAGPGIYVMGDEYVFRGLLVDNYVKFNNRLWRIMAINETGEVKLIENDLQPRIAWDNRYNEENRNTTGINTFVDPKTENSRIKIQLDEMIFSKEYLDTKNWGKLVYMDLCVGDRTETDNDKIGKSECRNKIDNQILALPAVYEFLRISLDPDCLTTDSRSCQNHNYFKSSNERFWTSTPVKDSTSRVYVVNYGYIYVLRASSQVPFKIVITLNDSAISMSGIGSLEDPYLLK